MLYAMTLFGVTFSGRVALVVGIVILVLIVIGVWFWQRRR